MAGGGDAYGEEVEKGVMDGGFVNVVCMHEEMDACVVRGWWWDQTRYSAEAKGRGRKRDQDQAGRSA